MKKTLKDKTMSGPVRRQRTVILKIGCVHCLSLAPLWLPPPSSVLGTSCWVSQLRRMVDESFQLVANTWIEWSLIFKHTHLFRRLYLRCSAPISRRAQNEPNQTKKPTFSFIHSSLHQSLTRFCTNCAGLIERLPFLSSLLSSLNQCKQGPVG